MDKTSVHGCGWNHGPLFSLIFDQKVPAQDLESGKKEQEQQ